MTGTGGWAVPRAGRNASSSASTWRYSPEPVLFALFRTLPRSLPDPLQVIVIHYRPVTGIYVLFCRVGLIFRGIGVEKVCLLRGVRHVSERSVWESEWAAAWDPRRARQGFDSAGFDRGEVQEPAVDRGSDTSRAQAEHGGCQDKRLGKRGALPVRMAVGAREADEHGARQVLRVLGRIRRM